jgi:hypothetical protein
MFIGVRTRDPSNREAADLRLRPFGRRDWVFNIFLHEIRKISGVAETLLLFQEVICRTPVAVTFSRSNFPYARSLQRFDS